MYTCGKIQIQVCKHIVQFSIPTGVPIGIVGAERISSAKEYVDVHIYDVNMKNRLISRWYNGNLHVMSRDSNASLMQASLSAVGGLVL